MLGDRLYDRYTNNSWDVNYPTLNGSKALQMSDTALTELRLLSLILRYSDTARAVQSAQSIWLDASSRIARDEPLWRSLPLDPHQWQLESRKLFNISLARMQTELLYMAGGRNLDRHYGGYDPLKNSLVDPYSMIKIRADGMKNISILGLLGMLGIAVSLWLTTIETGDTIGLIWLIDILIKPTLLALWSLLRKGWRKLVELLFAVWSWVVEAGFDIRSYSV